MIDLIRFSKKNLTATEIDKIIIKSRLNVRYDKDGFKCYENGKIKDLEGGFYIGIDKNNSLKVEGSLHKYYSFLETGKSSNFDSFTMHQAKETVFKLIENKGFEPINMNVNFYEIGINLTFDFDIIEILNNVYSIGEGITEKKLYINPIYRKERHRTTEIHYNFKVSYKIYDKIFEIIDKRGTPPPTNIKIVRIETIHKRIEKTYLLDFFTESNLLKMQTIFFSKWDKLNFDFTIDAPKGTHKSKQELAKELIRYGTETTRTKYKNLFNDNAVSVKIYRNINEFINNWNTDKYKFKIAKTPLHKIWAMRYNSEKQHYT